MKGLVEAGVIVFAALLLSAGSFFLRPDAVPWSTSEFEIELEEALDLDEAIWIDARSAQEFEESHLPSALLVSEDSWEEGFVALLDVWTPGSPIVVYCSTSACLRSRQVAERLRNELGVEEAYSLSGGWEALQDAGLVGKRL